ncbi:hypothetical protein EYC80_001171 [Monilinia laxa]|uniref:Uncharacterized protein n=1 Tax=Monilinia laxa TaxID=61186 RepID=A0A5N6K8B6_MONLA|nr:hypothetical protein EYC80_001171 [Monilinia laxa]
MLRRINKMGDERAPPNAEIVNFENMDLYADDDVQHCRKTGNFNQSRLFSTQIQNHIATYLYSSNIGTA